MKTNEMEPKVVYRIVERNSGEHVGVYSRAYHDEYDFDSVSEARGANVHGIYEDTVKYGVNKYKVTYELMGTV